MKPFLSICAFSVVLAASLSASSFRLNPIRIDLNEKHHAQIMTITNDGNTAVTVQAQMFRWTQQGGVDKLLLSTDVIMNPPIATIAPGASQIVRIGLRSKAPVENEDCYRIVVEEVPDPELIKTPGIHALLRFSVPIFVAGPVTKPSLKWSAENAHGQLLITATNTGSAHTKVESLAVDGVNAKIPISYLLAAQSKTWTVIPGDPIGKLITLTAQLDEKSVMTSVQVATAQQVAVALVHAK